MFIHDVFLLRLRELGEEHAACGGTFGLGIRLLKLLPAGVHCADRFYSHYTVRCGFFADPTECFPYGSSD
eukprot:g13943.t1